MKVVIAALGIVSAIRLMESPMSLDETTMATLVNNELALDDLEKQEK